MKPILMFITGTICVVCGLLAVPFVLLSWSFYLITEELNEN